MRVTTVQTKIDLSSVGTRFNDFKENELSKAINTDDRNEIIVKSWEKYAGSLESVWSRIKAIAYRPRVIFRE